MLIALRLVATLRIGAATVQVATPHEARGLLLAPGRTQEAGTLKIDLHAS